MAKFIEFTNEWGKISINIDNVTSFFPQDNGTSIIYITSMHRNTGSDTIHSDYVKESYEEVKQRINPSFTSVV